MTPAKIVVLVVSKSKKIIPIVCSTIFGLLILLSMIFLYSVSSDSQGKFDTNVSVTKIVTVTRNIISYNNTGEYYTDFTKNEFAYVGNDNGVITVGCYKWQGNNALDVFITAYNTNKEQFKDICTCYDKMGAEMLNIVQNKKDWSNYQITDKLQILFLTTLLSSDCGKKAQNIISSEQAKKYVDICTSKGIKDKRVIVYCCDILNQCGENSFETGGCLNGIDEKSTLEDLYTSQRAWSDGSTWCYQSRRTANYNYLKSIPILELTD